MSKNTQKQTAAGIQQQRETLERECAAMIDRRDAIRRQIAAEWDGDTSKLEAESASITERLASADVRRETLELEYRRARTSEALDAFTAIMQQAKAARDAEAALDVTIAGLNEQIKQAQQQQAELAEERNRHKRAARDLVNDTRPHFASGYDMDAFTAIWRDVFNPSQMHYQPRDFDSDARYEAELMAADNG